MTVSHDHEDHHQHRSGDQRRVATSLVQVAGYTAAEVVGGLWVNSLALLADAAHMFSDVGVLGLSLFALWVAWQPPTAQRTYGYYRTEILATLVNGADLIECGHCGHPIWGEKKIKRTKKEREYVYCRCAQYNSPYRPRIRLTEADLDRQLLVLFYWMRVENGEVRQWFVRFSGPGPGRTRSGRLPP